MGININIGSSTLLFFIFLTLKLCKVIDWSWWWITSPLWIHGILILIGLAVLFIVSWIKGEFN